MFHMQMSFLGSIGNMISGSGIEELFEEVYAEHTVTYMLSRKAYARALRAHFLAQSSLISHIINILIDEKNIKIGELEAVHSKVMKD